MKYISKLLTCMLLGFASCSEEKEIFDESFTPQTYDVQGKVEKGPFISGSEISIQPMDAKLQVLGSMFNTSITDDLGNFVLGSKEFPTPYAEFMANGYFFNEVKGQLSNGTLTLRALVDLKNNTTVNVNVLTHLKYARIKNLVASGKRFDEANEQAQKELLKAFGLSSYSSKEVSSFSIIAGTDESAALIAISSLLLMHRTEAALTEYLSKLSADFGKKGCFSTEIQTQISSDKNKLAIYLNDIKENIIERYKNLGISVNVKDLSHYIDWDNDGLAGNEILKENEQVKIEKSVIEVPNEGGEFTIQIDSPIALYLKPQVETDADNYLDLQPDNNVVYDSFFVGLYEGYDDSSFADKEISSESKLNDKTLVITVSALQSRTDQNKTILLYDYIGNVVGSIELKQEGKAVNVPVSEAPLLGNDAKNVVTSIALKAMEGLRDYNLIEQYYNYNKTANTIRDYVSPNSSRISSSWSKIYSAISMLLQLQKADEERLNVYADYCNVLSAMLYSNLVYGWGDVPYISDYNLTDIQRGIPRESTQNIFNNLKDKLLKAVENLPEKKNESTKDINGFFFTSKDVARVLLANLYMYEGNYSDAKPLLTKVIENGFYSLDASTDFKPSTTTDYVGVAESTEVIFAFLNDRGTRAGITIMEAGVMPYITLSDVYLSLAECQYTLGDLTSAEQYIKNVVDAKSLNVSESNVLLKIKEVREQILLYSGTYFAFLKRTHIAKNICGIEDFQLLFPIPSDELYTNMYITQNPGY